MNCRVLHYTFVESGLKNCKVAHSTRMLLDEKSQKSKVAAISKTVSSKFVVYICVFLF